MNHIQLILPAIFVLGVLMVLEYVVCRLRGVRGQDADDVMGSLAAGVLEQTTGAFLYVGLLAGYALVHSYAALLPMKASQWWVYPVGIVLVDIGFYAYHRFSHATAVGWAFHAVHHQANDVSFSTAVRNSVGGGVVQMMFMLPLAVLGLPPEAFLIGKAFNPLYQIWVHTRAIGPIPVLDAVLNTPSNHRVHHGVQAHYRDRNFGGVFVVWDRLLGTYTKEEEEPSYGVVPAFLSANPVRANMVPLIDLGRAVAKGGPGVLFGPPINKTGVLRRSRSTWWSAAKIAAALGLVIAIMVRGPDLVGVVLAVGAVTLLGWPRRVASRPAAESQP